MEDILSHMEKNNGKKFKINSGNLFPDFFSFFSQNVAFNLNAIFQYF